MTLEISHLTTQFGSVTAVDDISFSAKASEITTVIGANGAGKSTLLRTISGMLRPRTGSISFKGKNIVSTPPHEIVKAGISHSPEGRRIFTNMSVHENLQLGAYIRKDADIHKDMEAVLDRFPRLRERFKQNSGTMSGGEQQMLAIGRALMSRPELLLLDEPSLGLAPAIVETMYESLQALHKAGLTLLLAEQSIPLALDIADYAYVLQTGRIALEGKAADLEQNQQVQEIYLGIRTPAAGATD